LGVVSSSSRLAVGDAWLLLPHLQMNRLFALTQAVDPIPFLLPKKKQGLGFREKPIINMVNNE